MLWVLGKGRSLRCAIYTIRGSQFIPAQKVGWVCLYTLNNCVGEYDFFCPLGSTLVADLEAGNSVAAGALADAIEDRQVVIRNGDFLVRDRNVRRTPKRLLSCLRAVAERGAVYRPE